MSKDDDLESTIHVSRESTWTDPEKADLEQIIELEGDENPRNWCLRKKAITLALTSLFALLS
jgi:hypothetical protein